MGKEQQMRTVGPRLVAGLVAAGLLLSGCGGSPEPGPPPKSTKSTTPSPSATPTPPVMPEAAKARTREGAITFVRHYIQVLNYATFSGDTRGASSLDGGQCTSCSRMLAAIDSIYDKGGRVEGGAWAPTPVSDVAAQGGVGWTVDTKITYGPQSVYAEAGAEPKKYTGGGRLVSFILEAADGGGWRVAEWTRAS